MRAVATINLLIIALVIGVIVSHGVGDGLDRFSGERRAVAEEAFQRAELGCLDNPIGRVYSSLRVTSVREVPVDLSEPPPGPEETRLVGYDVKIRVHALFAIPTRTIRVTAKEVDCGLW